MKPTHLFIVLFFLSINSIVSSLLASDSGNYAILTSAPQQIIKGLGVEIQSDSIGSGNNGLPDEVVCVPHDLVESEKMRFYTELMAGFRFVHIIERYPGQMEGLYNMSLYSGIEGYAIEYWSPAPYWKSNNNYINGELLSFNQTFLTQFGNALIQDIEYLMSYNLTVAMWGLQNEPPVGWDGCTYSCCGYTSEQYYQTFKVVGPMLKAKFPNLYIHVDSWGGQSQEVQILNDTSLHPYFDAWSWHEVGANSNDQIQYADHFNANNIGKAIFSNEFEYLNSNASDLNCLNTAQSIMNWLTFENSPTWFWLHALKPTYNSEASGYSLGFWRPWDDNNTNPDHFPTLQKGYWEYNYKNWYSIAGFLKYMGWDSQRYLVKEDVVRNDQRILCFSTTQGNLVFVLTNRENTTFTFMDALEGSSTFNGHLYTPYQADTSLGNITLDPKTPASRSVQYLSIEFWVQEL